MTEMINHKNQINHIKITVQTELKNMTQTKKYPLELNTMPGFAGSSAYYLRYQDPINENALVSKEANEYWRNVDLYIGGTEHATGHLIYSRFWNKFLFDLGVICEDEPFKKLINQGMIQGRSNFVYRFDFFGKMTTQTVAKPVSISGNMGVEELRQITKEHELEKGNTLTVIFHNRDISDETLQQLLEESELGNINSLWLVASEPSTEELQKTIETYEDDILYHSVAGAPKIFLSLEKYLKFKEGEITKKDLYDIVISRFPYFTDIQEKNRVEIDIDSINLTPLHVDVNIVSNDVLDIEKFKAWRPEFADAEFILEDGKYICGWAIEKMSKSYHNVVNPDDIVENYGADTLRLYEMFLGPLEQSKPWDTNGIDGVHRFLKRLWALFYDRDGNLIVNDEKPTADELKTLHKTIKKIAFDIEHFSFNTAVSAFMICVNELGALKCSKREILEPLLVTLSPFAPHICEELYQKLGHETSIYNASFPQYDEKYLVEATKKYPISFNGKVRFTLELPADMSKEEVEKTVLADEQTAKYLEGATVKKIIVVPGKIVNVVV